MQIEIQIPKDITIGEPVRLTNDGKIAGLSKVYTPRCPKCGKFAKLNSSRLSNCCNQTSYPMVTQKIVDVIVGIHEGGKGWVKLANPLY